MDRKLFRTFLCSFLFVFSYSSALLADDTDIYLGDPDAEVIRPNVLFVLDISDSMGQEVVGTGKDRLGNMREAMTELISDLDNVNVGLMRFNGRRFGDNETPTGGAVIFPVTNLDADISSVPSEADLSEQTIALSLSDPDDDVEETSATGAMVLNSPTLEIADNFATNTTITSLIVTDTDNARANLTTQNTATGALQIKVGAQGIGLRYQNLPIPTDATITAATIKFTARVTGGNTVNTVIEGEKNAAPATFNNSENMANRPRTATNVAWSIPNFVAGNEYVTTDISAIISELTSSTSGWVAGNDLALFVTPTSGTPNKTRQPIRFQDDPAKAPILEITYQTSLKKVGTRFQNVLIPQGSIITNAEIDFLSDDPSLNSATSTTTYIDVEDADDAAAYTTAVNDLSARSYSGSPVTWVLPAVTGQSINDTVTTADITALVQQVVNRSGWCGGNSLAFKFASPPFAGGPKVLKSADTPTDPANPSGAPVLRVTFDQSNLAANEGCIRKTLVYQSEHKKDDGYQILNANNKMKLGNVLQTGEINGDATILGLRFSGVQVDPADKLVSAEIEMITSAAGSGPTNLTIAGHDQGNMPRLSGAEIISDTVTKPRTTASVVWPITSDSNQGEKLVSPDLTTVISEVIQDPANGWTPGNALGFYLENGTNLRKFHSLDSNLAFAPRLKLVIETKVANQITVRDRVLQLVSEQTHTLNRTPSIETLYEAAAYWRGDDVYYGTHRGQGNFPNGVPNPNDDNLAVDPDIGMHHGRVSHPDSYTGGSLNQPAGCTAANLDAPECYAEVIDGNPVYVSPFDIAECQSNYMIFLSDGAPTQNNEAPALIKELTGEANCDTNAKGPSGACGINLLRYLNTEDQSNALDGDQTVTTFTVGFNIGDAGNAATVDFMKELAVAGGGQFKSADTASELSASMTAIFSEIFTDPTSFAAPALQVNAFNKLQHRNEVYFSLFEPAKETRWDGNVKKYKVCDGTGGCTLGEIIDADKVAAINSDGVISSSAKSFWSNVVDGPDIRVGGAGSAVPSPDFRNVYTYTGAGSPVNVDLGDAVHQIHIDNFDNLDELLGFTDSIISNPAPDPATADADQALLDLIEWIRGIDSFDEDADGDTTDLRWPIADPLHGSPVAITFGCQSGVPGTPCADTGDNAIIKVFATGNDGSVRMLNGNNGNNGGEEEWVFYPQIMLGQQAALAINAEGDHGYGVDNTPTVIQSDTNGDAMIDPLTGEYVRLFFSMRRGGDSIFALDVTPDSTVLTDTDGVGGITPRYMWRIDGSSTLFPNLGQTWSRPKPAKIKVPKSGGGVGDSELKTVLIFGAGYDDNQDDEFAKSNLGNGIYIIDAETGDRIWWASNDEVIDGNGDSPNLVLTHMDYPIPSDIALVDTSGDGAINRLYVGDLGGQVWRIDLDDQLGGPQTGPANSQDDSSGARLAILSNPDTDSANIEDHRKFFYPPDIIQVEDAIFSNEASYDLVTIISGDRANPLETDVLNRAYGLRDYAVGDALVEGGQFPLRHAGYDIGDGTIDGDANGDSEKDLFDTTENLIQVGTSTEQSLAKAAMQASSGWFVDLTDNGTKVGEKGLSSPIILAGKLFFTTFLPSTTNDPCLAIEGSGRLYGINAITAAAEFEDWLEGGIDTAFETGDRTYALGGGIPSSAVPIFQEQGVTLLIGTGGGAESVDPDIALPRVRTYWYQEQ